MKVGDLLECVDVANCRDIHIGGIYKCVEVNDTSVRIIDDVGEKSLYGKRRFKVQTWITDRPPTADDADESGEVAVTWKDGHVSRRRYSDIPILSHTILAWAPRSKQPLPPAYVPPSKEPTQADIGKEVEVSDGDDHWVKRKLITIHDGLFFCQSSKETLYGWSKCRLLT